MGCRMSSLDFVACQTFAGCFDLGAVQAGMRLVRKVENKGGFGLKNVRANLHLVGEDWDWQACPPPDWEPIQASVMTGNPPCSGFSVLSAKDFRGVDSRINACMHDLVEYGAKCGVTVLVMESVQQAYWKGLPLMRQLRDKFEALSGLEGRVWLNHVLHNAHLVGNTSERRRYFMVLTVDRPFVVHDSPKVIESRFYTLLDAIGDLEAQPLAVASQPYTDDLNVSPYAKLARGDEASVDGHFVRPGKWSQVVQDMLEDFGDKWSQGDHMSKILTRSYDETGEIHRHWKRVEDKLLRWRDEYGFQMGYNQPTRWVYDKPSRVITGGAGHVACHPVLNRLLTFREQARIMGYPDSWHIAPNATTTSMNAWWGKQLTVECAEWVSDDVRRWFDEEEIERLDPDAGLAIGDRELMFEKTYWPSKTYDTHKHKRNFDEIVRIA